jgi:O-succinylbenzoate synthase
VVNRRGAIKLGCLVQLMLLAAVGYFGWGAGEVYLRYLRFKDVVNQEMQFRSRKTIPEIRQRIQFLADSLEMPEEAGISLVRKTSKETSVEVHWDETIILPGFRREVHFEVKAKGTV